MSECADGKPGAAAPSRASSPALVSIAIGLSGLALLPYFAVQWLCLCVLVGGVCLLRNRAVIAVLLAAVVTAAFATSFLLNPLSYYLSRTVWPELPAARVMAATQAVLAVVGLGWAAACLYRARAPVVYRLLPAPRVAACMAGGLLVAYYSTWLADIAYRGDEGYHIFSVHLARLFICDILARPLLALATAAWLGAGAWLAWHGTRTRTVRWPALVGWVAAGLALAAAAAPWAYNTTLLVQGQDDGRFTRYPTAVPWLAAAVGSVCRENWGGRWLFKLELMRFVPFFSIFAIGCLFAGDRRWRQTPWYLPALAALAMVTVPNLIFHGTILYLELPAVLLLTIVLADGQRWLTRAPDQVTRTPAWWALILLSVIKETCLPISLGMLGVRLLAQLRLGSEPIPRRLRAEARLWLAALLPYVVYLAARSHAGDRPYGGQWLNLVDPTLWLASVRWLWLETGLLLVLAAAGAVVAWRQHRRWLVAACVMVFVGEQAFFIADDAGHVGLARFHLLVLPPLFVLGWTALTAVARRRPQMAMALVAAVIGVNVLLSPINRAGERAAWGNSGERWYPFVDLLLGVRQQAPSATVLIANMDSQYAITAVFNLLRWPTDVTQTGPVTEDETNIARTLEAAHGQRVDCVVYRLRDDERAPAEGTAVAGYQLVSVRHARAGGLLLWVRIPDAADGG
jgi:hypothetical protein